jgi:RND family efflux transporter MFP subunit
VPLRVIEAPVVDLVPRVVGYGQAEPGRVWRAIVEVKGRVIETYPHLEAGVLITEGTVLLRIDPADYELSVARLQAGIAQTQAKLAELEAEQQNTRTALEIETESLALAQKSLDRLRTLLAEAATSVDQVDREERNVLQQRQVIQRLESTLALVPARRQALEAALAVDRALLRQAELDLERTVLAAPFACRLGHVNIEPGQFLNAGQELFEAHSTEVVEIQARFRPEQLRGLLSTDKRIRLESPMTMDGLRELFDLEVVVRLRSGAWESVWPARFDRIREAVDPRTRDISVVVAVDHPYDQVIPGIRPALAAGMYCEVELRAPARPGTLVVPRSAVRNGSVFVVDADGRLRVAEVTVTFEQDDLAVLDSGLEAGSVVVASDPGPAIEGMKVEPVRDTELLNRIVAQAEGTEGQP